MQFLIVGSTNFPASTERLKEDFKDACREIGAALAKAGHILVLGSDRPHTADFYITEGANGVEGVRTKVLIYGPDDGPTPFAGERDKFANIEFSYHRINGPWTVGRVHQILAADAVILIGGALGVTQTGYSAPMLQRPVLAIPSFGGAAADVWRQLESDYKRVEGFTAKANNLRESWHRTHAEIVVKLVEDLVKRNPYKIRDIGSQLSLLLALLILLTAWVILFVYPLNSKSLTFFILLGLSALLGTGLRTTLRLNAYESSRISVRQLINEITIGLILAFGLALFYLSGGLVVTGRFDFVKLADDNDFIRVSIMMSLLGLAASVLIEGTSTKFKKLLENMLAGDTK